MDSRTTQEIILSALAALDRIEQDLDALAAIGEVSQEPLRQEVAQRRAECLKELLACQDLN